MWKSAAKTHIQNRGLMMEDLGQTPLPLNPTDTVDPLLSLMVDLAICYQALAEQRGLLCAACTCSLGFHISCDNGECEFCGCDEVRRVCASCDKVRSLEMYEVGGRVCKFCVANPPVLIPPYSSKGPRIKVFGRRHEPDERAMAARMALRELTE